MADQQRIAAPYGDIFFVNTPTIDRWAQQMYVEQKQREAKQQQENAALDASISKELGKVRSVDAPEIIQDYHDLKQIKKQMLFNKDLQKDPVAFNQMQQEALRKYQGIVSKSNASSEIKDMAKTMNADHFKNPWDYTDDYGQRMQTLNNTPISQLGNHPVYGSDLTNWDKYRYDGSNVDFSKKVNLASGENRQIRGKEEQLDKQGIQFRTPVYQYKNTPAQVFNSLVNSMDHETERAAQVKWKKLDPEEVQRTEQEFNSIPQSKWEQMGEKGPQQLNIRGGSDAEKYMRYLAQRNAIDNNPTLFKYDPRTSDKAKMDYKFAQDKVMEGLRFGHQKQLKKQEQDQVDNWIVGYWDKRFNEAKSGQPVPLPGPKTPTLTYKMGYQLNPDQVMLESLKKAGAYPDEVYVTPNNKLLPVFYQYKEVIDPETGKKLGSEVDVDEDGNPKVDESLTKPLELDQAYLSMGYKGQTKKELGGTMQGAYNKNTGSKNNIKKNDPLGLF